MAEKRMLSKSICDSDAFLSMPMSSQALYFHLNLRADDDGFVNNPKRITAYVGASEDDLKLLLMKRFILGFESGVIVIKHWRMHNTIRQDRYKPTDYQEEFRMLGLKKNNAYTLTEAETLCIQNGNQMATEWQPNGNQMETQYRVEENRVDKNRLDKSSNTADSQQLLLEEYHFDEWLEACVKDWLNYKKEKRQTYKPTGLRQLLKTIKGKADEYGAKEVAETIYYSMSNNYQGIVWAKLDDKKKPAKPKTEYAVPTDDETDRLRRLLNEM